MLALSLGRVVLHVVHHEVRDVDKLEAAVPLNVPDSDLHQLSPVGKMVDRPVKGVGNLSVSPEPSVRY